MEDRKNTSELAYYNTINGGQLDGSIDITHEFCVVPGEGDILLANTLLPTNRFEGKDPYAQPANSASIAQRLEMLELTYQRLSPAEAYNALKIPGPPAILIDIRPVQQRHLEGEIPGATIIERNVLEWRLDTKSDSKLQIAGRYDLRPILFCSEGYATPLAVRSLHHLGLHNATDIIGGYKAWKDHGFLALPLPGLYLGRGPVLP